MEAVKVFLDANILFSASLGGATFQLLWDLAASGKVSLCTSRYCYIEATENLHRKRANALPKFQSLMASVSMVSDAPERLEWAHGYVRDKDAPVLAAAVKAGVHVLITGDVRDFGPLMERDDLPVAVRTIKAFLLEWPLTR